MFLAFVQQAVSGTRIPCIPHQYCAYNDFNAAVDCKASVASSVVTTELKHEEDEATATQKPNSATCDMDKSCAAEEPTQQDDPVTTEDTANATEPGNNSTMDVTPETHDDSLTKRDDAAFAGLESSARASEETAKTCVKAALDVDFSLPPTPTSVKPLVEFTSHDIVAMDTSTKRRDDEDESLIVHADDSVCPLDALSVASASLDTPSRTASSADLLKDSESEQVANEEQRQELQNGDNVTSDEPTDATKPDKKEASGEEKQATPEDTREQTTTEAEAATASANSDMVEEAGQEGTASATVPARFVAAGFPFDRSFVHTSCSALVTRSVSLRLR